MLTTVCWPQQGAVPYRRPGNSGPDWPVACPNGRRLRTNDRDFNLIFLLQCRHLHDGSAQRRTSNGRLHRRLGAERGMQRAMRARRCGLQHVRHQSHRTERWDRLRSSGWRGGHRGVQHRRTVPGGLRWPLERMVHLPRPVWWWHDHAHVHRAD